LEKLRVIELFAGIGAWSKALENLGIPHTVLEAIESDPKTMTSYNLIHGTNFQPVDITQVEENALPDCDLICYSPPCQSWSTAGRQLGFEDQRGVLFFDALRIIKAKKPKYAVMENVKGLTQKKFKFEFETMLQLLEQEGYRNYWKVLNAKDYGIPQNRERVFIVSVRKDIDVNFEFPEPLNGVPRFKLKDALESKVEDKYYFGRHVTDKIDTSEIKHTGYVGYNVKGKEIEFAHTLGARDFKGMCNQGMNVVKEYQKFSDYLEDEIDDKFILSEKELNYMNRETRDGRTHWDFKHHSDTNDDYAHCITANFHKGVPYNVVIDRRHNLQDFLEEDAELPVLHNIYGGFKETQPRVFNEYSPTIRTAAGGGHIPSVCTKDEKLVEKQVGEHKIRKYTPKECFRLMGFDDKDVDVLKENKISNTHLYRMSGNSICVNVPEVIFQKLFNIKYTCTT
jgi:DNA (cytosine-5)-methyltransferase 1